MLRGRNKDIASLFLLPYTRWVLVVKANPWLLYPWDGDTVSIVF